MVLYKCENCGIDVTEKYSSGRFCAVKCARSFSTKRKRKEIDNKISKALTGKKYPERKPIYEYKDVECGICRKIFKVRTWLHTRFCSKSCVSSYISRKRVFEGTHNGFPSRKEKQPSWAEKTVMTIFDERKIEYKRDFKINRFFGDFVFVDKKIVLEIDGKQHKERVEQDKKRDEIINKEGYKVIRIDWIHKKLEEMTNKIDNFIKLYLDIV